MKAAHTHTRTNATIVDHTNNDAHVTYKSINQAKDASRTIQGAALGQGAVRRGK